MPNPRSSAKNIAAILEYSSSCEYRKPGDIEKFDTVSTRASGVGFGFRVAIRFPKSEVSGCLIRPYYKIAKLVSFRFELFDSRRDE